MDEALLQLVAAYVPGERPLELLDVRLEVVGMGDSCNREGHQLLFRVAQELAGCTIYLQYLAVSGDQ